MPRQRHQNGSVEKTKTKPQRWNGRYAIYVIENGQEKRKSRETILGLVSELTKGDAEEKLRTIIRQETGAAPSGAMTLWEFMHHPTTGYIALRSPCWTPAWKETLEGLYEKHFKVSIAALKLSEINRANCQAWLNKIGSKGFSQSLIHKCKTQLAAILREACVQELVQGNFFLMAGERNVLTEPVSARKVKRPVMTLAQVAAGLRYTRRLKSKRDYLIFRLATTRGLRPSELFAIRVNDLQGNSLMIDEGVVEYRVGDPKTDSSAAPVALTADLRKELEGYIQVHGLSGDDFLFAYSTGIPMSQNNYVRRQMKTIGKKIGVPGMDFRMLRRTFATHFKKHGDPKDLQSAMRHADVTMSLEVYQQEIPEETFRAVASYEDEIMALVEAA